MSAVTALTPPTRLTKIRGLMVGLAYGDAYAAGSPTGAGSPAGAGTPWPSGVSSQLAAFTAEGMIRASVRYAHKGICHPPSVVWHAYRRWAAVQGIAGADTGDVALDGWLSAVPIVARRRGSANATVQALRGGKQGSVEAPATNSAGLHAVTRVLPMAAMLAPQRVSLAGEVAALTHGHPSASDSAVAAVTITRHLLAADVYDTSSAAHDAVSAGVSAGGRPGHPGIAMALDGGQRAVEKFPRDAAMLKDLVQDGSAVRALVGAAYLIECFPGREQIGEALELATQAVVPEGVCTLVAAFAGALHGFDALPIELVADLEMLWVMDTLARDMVTETDLGPSGGEYAAPTDPTWWDRYPGY